jgi:hypothetical protein
MKTSGRALSALLLAALLPAADARAAGPALAPVRGVIWQLNEDAAPASGAWQKLGAHELLIQWTAADGVAFVPGTGLRESRRMPDWQRIAREPWAERVIVGLSARSDERQARRSLDAMLSESLTISRLRFPFRVAGWYFPAEVDPTWKEARTALPPVLDRLPRPLWISAYDAESIGAAEFVDWIASWLPRDVGVLFQDGVGLHVRSPAVARRYAEALAARIGKARMGLIVEAFREDGGKLRPATAGELRSQLSAYHGFALYLFEGPHYVSDRLVDEVLGR